MTDMPGEIWAYRDEYFDHRWNHTNVVESVKYLRFDLVEQAAKVAEVTEEEISAHIHEWRFDDNIDSAFGAYLMKTYPHGLRIVDAAQQQEEG